MSKNGSNVFRFLLMHVLLKFITTDECKILPKDPCVCQTTRRKINFRDIGLKNGEPRFRDIPDSKSQSYFYNPCLTFAEGSCTGATACQKSGTGYYKLASVPPIYSGDPDLKTLQIKYKAVVQEGTTRQAVVNVKCKQCSVAQLTSQGESPGPTPNYIIYTFTLETEIVCEERCPSSSGLSTGSILLILFFVFFAIYWIGGILFLKYVRKAQGVELIPNYTFWKDLPLLIRDGVVFVISGCKSQSTYEQI
ncbi:hypothetical protein SNE40_023030 [Patella caerulea]|uniref:Cation-dependent mannose-6-phosphate receptor n=1 Tax=Patella caerulea TaxID=87958 RepID=A0AAN8GG42_PATCE